MAVKYTPGQRAEISADAKGKVVESLEYSEAESGDPVGGYWVMTFTNGSEMSFRFMAELYQPGPPGRP